MTDRLHHTPITAPLTREQAESMAQTMRAFGTASRLLLLWGLAEGDQTVEGLCSLAGMEQSAVSHQLRVLRGRNLVVVRREGRQAHYRLFDHHLPELLSAIRNHQEHVIGTS